MKFSAGIGEHWIDSACISGRQTLLSDTMGTALNAKRALTGSIVLARHIKKLSPEQNIGIMLPTSVGGMLTNMATMLLGKTAVNINFTGSIDSILSAVNQAEIKTIYTSARFLDKLAERGMDFTALEQTTRLIMLEDLAKETSSLGKTLTFLLCKLAPAALLKKLYCTKHPLSQTAVILFSSGSEGKPKGVILSHNNILTNVMQIERVLEFNHDDVILANLPLFHSFGLTVTQFLPLLMHVPVVCHADPIDVFGTAKAITKFNVTIMFGTSTLYRLYIRNNKIQTDWLASLRLVISGAEKLQPQVIEDFKHKFKLDVYEGYGATETSPVACVNIPSHLSDNYNTDHLTHREGSVGMPLLGTTFKIVDPDSFQTLPVNTPGMILISGGQVMQGYLNDDDRTALALKNIDNKIWYVSGDKGMLDEDGFLYIQDRYSRFAKIGGEMVALSNIEIAIRVAVNDVDLEVLAVNIPDAKKGEKIIILCTQELDETFLRQKLTAAGMQTLSLPSSYKKVTEIPTLGSGKTDYYTAKVIALSDQD